MTATENNAGSLAASRASDVTLAIIGGTGLTSMEGLVITRREMIKTPYGSPSGPLIFGELDGIPLAFLARHGHKHSIPPHRINYSANVWALHAAGIKKVIAVGAVGGIAEECVTGSIVIPDQVIDYTYGRSNTYFDGKPEAVRHIDFSYPYTDHLRSVLATGCAAAGVLTVDGGIYGCTQGPRLETVAEIARMEREGCTVVGMTGMPEAALARELELEYACCAVVVNKAAGKQRDTIDTETMSHAIEAGMASARSVLLQTLSELV